MKTIFFAVILICLNAGFGYLNNLPQSVGPDVPEGKLNSLSFAPFREGQGPLETVFPSVAEIEADLQLMGNTTHNIRTYASAEGNMPALPPLAKKYGLTMLQGAWLSSEVADNQREVDALITAANTYPDVIKRVIVGNEVLLRGDLPPEKLIEYIRQVKRAVKQPVSTADVWSMYMKYPQLIKEVDFITIHILPYWEDEPILVDDAPAHIERIYKQVQREANALVPNIPILIGESGWPGAGRQRGVAIPSVVNEAKFIRGLLQVAKDNGFDCNIVEAFNQPWKSELEGVVGANWGLYSVARDAVFPLTGNVYENPQWQKGVLLAIGLFILAVCYLWQPLQQLTTGSLLACLAFLQLAWVLWVKQGEQLWFTSYSDWQRLETLGLLLLSGGIGGLLWQRLYASAANAVFPRKLDTWLNTLYMVCVLYALYKTYALALHGRYISFPTVSTAIPVAGIVALCLLRLFRREALCTPLWNTQLLLNNRLLPAQWRSWLVYGLWLLAAGLVLGESWAFLVSRDFVAAYPDMGKRIFMAFNYTLHNGQLLGWLCSVAVLALPLWVDKLDKPTVTGSATETL